MLPAGCSPLDVHVSDFITIGLLVLLEGLLSADNALVLAVLVLGLPREQQRNALRYGILGAFVFRALATTFAALMIRLSWIKLAGAAYRHFGGGASADERRSPKPATAWPGLTAFWTTVIKVELTDIVFAVDSILVAVAMSPKLWVIITGGILGIIAMRLLIGQFLVVVRRYPPLVDGAFVIIAWVAVKLLVEFMHQAGALSFEIPRWVSLALIVVIFGAAYAYARRQGPVASHEDVDDPTVLLPAVDATVDVFDHGRP
jgi:YkoY family integral membrane protein